MASSARPGVGSWARRGSCLPAAAGVCPAQAVEALGEVEGGLATKKKKSSNKKQQGHSRAQHRRLRGTLLRRGYETERPRVAVYVPGKRGGVMCFARQRGRPQHSTV